MQPQSSRYTYQDAGFNGFLIRSLKSNSGALSVADGLGIGSNEVNLSLQQMSGVLGDTVTFGKIKIDGRVGRISVEDKNGVEGAWLGNLDS